MRPGIGDEYSKGTRLPKGTVLSMPLHLRTELSRSLGMVLQEREVLANLRLDRPVATVGDMCTATLHRLGVPIHIAVVDYQTKREPDASWADLTGPVGERTVRVRSPQGEITAELWNAIAEAWEASASTKVVVEGEEDLASLPAILHAPEGATVIYGIPDKGLALVQVQGHVREVVAGALARFVRTTAGSAP
jgi:hypothetical protein